MNHDRRAGTFTRSRPEPLPMKILVVAASKRESAPLLRRRLPGVECLVTGAGSRNAEAALREWLKGNSAEAVIVAGLAGALSSNLRIGDLVVDRQASLAAILLRKIE